MIEKRSLFGVSHQNIILTDSQAKFLLSSILFGYITPQAHFLSNTQYLKLEAK